MFYLRRSSLTIATRGLVTLDGESVKAGLGRAEILTARMVDAQERSRALLKRAMLSLGLAAERRAETIALRAEADRLKGELRSAVSEYVVSLRAMNVEPERMLVLVKTLVDTPTLAQEMTSRELRDDLIRAAIEAYYAG